MDMVKGILREELDYAIELRQQYLNKISELPKDGFSIKVINGREYAYRQHREGRKVVSKCLSKEEAIEFKQKADERKRYRRLLKEVEEKISYIRKALNVKGK